MIDEIVIDTNVLAHCYNPNEERCEYALELVQRIIAGNEVMCIDAGFDVVESRNRSVIGGEYLRNVRVGTPGYALITTLATTGRIRLLPARPQQAVYRQIMRLIRNKGDRVFVGVAHATFDKVLVSHDFTDFDTAKRSQIRRTLGVDIIEADECCNRL